MIRNIINLILYTILVFIQVFFVDNFEIKIGLIFIPLLYLLLKNETLSFINYSFVLFVSNDFFKNSFVSYSLFIFLAINFVLTQFSKIWSKESLLYLNFLAVFLIYYLFGPGITDFSFALNITLLGLVFLVVRVVKSGFIRLN